MKSLFLCSLVFLSSFVSVNAFATLQQRVLLSFDGQGYRLVRVIRPTTVDVEDERMKSFANAEKALDVRGLITRQSAGSAKLVWVDGSGGVQATTIEPDPRVAHGPAHIDGTNESRKSRSEGAWLVSGPASAFRVIILMPEVANLGLPQERWEVDLNQ